MILLVGRHNECPGRGCLLMRLGIRHIQETDPAPAVRACLAGVGVTWTLCTSSLFGLSVTLAVRANARDVGFIYLSITR